MVVVCALAALAACGKVKDVRRRQRIDGTSHDASGSGCDLRSCGMTADGCCPSACNAANDADCAAICDNGVVEPGETCDPLSSCPTACPQIGCQLRTLDQGGTCGAQCSRRRHADRVLDDLRRLLPVELHRDRRHRLQRGLRQRHARARRAVRSAVELPDRVPGPGLPALQAVRRRHLPGPVRRRQDADRVRQRRRLLPVGLQRDQRQRLPARSATTASRSRARPAIRWGRARPRARRTGCQLYDLVKGGTCQAACQAGGTISACANGDQCCPSGCNANNDDDCMPGCGNGVIEPRRDLRPAVDLPDLVPAAGLPAVHPGNGGTCSAACQAAGTQTKCVNDDGCCPSGCNANNDNDCKPSCGNGVVESGETCDPPSSCTCGKEAYTCFTTTGKRQDLRPALPRPGHDLRHQRRQLLRRPTAAPSARRATTRSAWAPGGASSHINDVDTTKGCVTVRVYGIDPGGSYLVDDVQPAGPAGRRGRPGDQVGRQRQDRAVLRLQRRLHRSGRAAQPGRLELQERDGLS